MSTNSGSRQRAWLLSLLMIALSTACDLRPSSTTVTLNQPFPPVSLDLLEGGSVELSQLQGQVVLLKAWASWCVSCRQSAPLLTQLLEEFTEQELRIVALSVDNDLNLLREHLLDHPNGFIQAIDPDRSITRETLGFTAVPEIFVLDRKGVLRHRITGTIDETSIRGWLRALVDEPGATPLAGGQSGESIGS